MTDAIEPTLESNAVPVVSLNRSGITRYDCLPRPVKIIFLVSPLVPLVLFVMFWFSVPMVGGKVLIGTSYYFAILIFVGANVFLGFGATRRQHQQAPRWFDYGLALLLLAICIICWINRYEIGNLLWVRDPSGSVIALAAVLTLLLLEAARRVAGWSLLVLLLLALVYPLVAGMLPVHWPISGFGMSISQVITNFTFGDYGILGFGALIIGHRAHGYIFFAACFLGLGGGEFIYNLARCCFRRLSAGAVLSAVVSGALAGGFSPAGRAAVRHSAAFHLPLLRVANLPAEDSAAITASSVAGGYLMPPLMGGLAFLLVASGATAAMVALIFLLPALLVLAGYLVQANALTNRQCEKIVPTDVPASGAVLRQGWPFLVSVAFLIFGLIMRWDSITPLYAAILLLILVALNRDLTRQKVADSLVNNTGMLTFCTILFMVLGLVWLGGMKTGVIARSTNWSITAGAWLYWVVLILMALFCLACGWFGQQLAGYVFGVVPLYSVISMIGQNTGVASAALLIFFIMCLALGGILPGGKFARLAAAEAGASPWRVGWLSTRLGILLLVLPIYLFFDQSLLIINQPPGLVVGYFASSLLGVWLLGSGLGGYLTRVGVIGGWRRALLILGGLLVIFPFWPVVIVGLILASLALIRVRRGQPPDTPFVETV